MALKSTTLNIYSNSFRNVYNDVKFVEILTAYKKYLLKT